VLQRTKFLIKGETEGVQKNLRRPPGFRVQLGDLLGKRVKEHNFHTGSGGEKGWTRLSKDVAANKTISKSGKSQGGFKGGKETEL